MSDKEKTTEKVLIKDLAPFLRCQFKILHKLLSNSIEILLNYNIIMSFRSKIRVDTVKAAVHVIKNWP